MTESTTDRDPRIYMAAERTFLAWIRTGLALMAFGFIVARVAVMLRVTGATQHVPGAESADADTSLWLGVTLIVGGMATCLGAGVRNARYVRAIDRGEFRTTFGSGLANGIVALLTLAGGAILLVLARS